MSIFFNRQKFVEYNYQTEEEFERDITRAHKAFCGRRTIYVDAKKKLDSKSLGGAIPDGFLFDLSDPDSPEFYLVEVELVGHSFYNHIFPQVTKFFAFFRNTKRQKDLVDKLFSIANTDQRLKKEFKKFLGEKEIHKFLSDVTDASQNILLIVDGQKRELPEIMETYSDTWGKMVKLMIIRKFIKGNDEIFAVDPDFETIEYPAESEEELTEARYSEEFHLEGVHDSVKQVYNTIKSQTLAIESTIVFNPQKYYISIRSPKNIAFLLLRKKKIRMIPMLAEDEIRRRIRKHSVKRLSEPVQKFYNHPCAAVDILDTKNMDEVIAIIRLLVARVPV